MKIRVPETSSLGFAAALGSGGLGFFHYAFIIAAKTVHPNFGFGF